MHVSICSSFHLEWITLHYPYNLWINDGVVWASDNWCAGRNQRGSSIYKLEKNTKSTNARSLEVKIQVDRQKVSSNWWKEFKPDITSCKPLGAQNAPASSVGQGDVTARNWGLTGKKALWRTEGTFCMAYILEETITLIPGSWWVSMCIFGSMEKLGKGSVWN